MRGEPGDCFIEEFLRYVVTIFSESQFGLIDWFSLLGFDSFVSINAEP